MASANQLPEIILAENPSMPLSPKDLIEGYEDELKAVSGRFANELSSISHAADENQMSGQQAEETSKERFQVAMMQFQLLVALRANLEREIDRADRTAQGAPRPSQPPVQASRTYLRLALQLDQAGNLS